ncbi:unnamed protein product [Cuscuta epithymum]|uniref:Uncharacterized protein n=1 Tax=Cuscuta epithymum TaxID=186058 RepID=A0AAV0CXM1_9ASTE|nr:unnamed protein product [Cuscuta epithymum]
MLSLLSLKETLTQSLKSSPQSSHKNRKLLYINLIKASLLFFLYTTTHLDSSKKSSQAFLIFLKDVENFTIIQNVLKAFTHYHTILVSSKLLEKTPHYYYSKTFNTSLHI